MAGYVARPVGQEYVSKKLSGTVAVKNGTFVVDNVAAGTYDIPSDDAKAKIAFVENEIDYACDYNVDDKDFTVAGGELIRCKPVIDTEMYITDMIGSTYAGISKGDEVGVGADGKVYLIADLTAADFTTFKTTFLVEKKTKLMLVDALLLVANVK